MAKSPYKEKLKSFEDRFLSTYPGGFADPGLEAIGKKHKMEQTVEFAQEVFAKQAFKDHEDIIENMIRLVSKSSMVSLFEKPKFRDYVRSLAPSDQVKLSDGLKTFLHGKNQQKGFNMMLEILESGKLAKWSLITVFGAYYAPNEEVFVKPTTCKNVLKTFAIDEIQYKPKPSWEFYERYREIITEMKGQVDSSLSPSNAAFGGFLMMSMETQV